MSHYDYEVGLKISARDYPFYALIQAAMRQADSNNITRLRHAFPAVWSELRARYTSPGGRLASDDMDELRVRIVENPAPGDSDV